MRNVGQTMIWEQNKVKLLGVNIDSKLSFNDHVTSLCVKAGRKLTALTRIARSLTTEKRRILINAFVESQFNYCRLVWMFHSRKLNNKINKLQERSLRIICGFGYSYNLETWQGYSPTHNEHFGRKKIAGDVSIFLMTSSFLSVTMQNSSKNWVLPQCKL